MAAHWTSYTLYTIIIQINNVYKAFVTCLGIRRWTQPTVERFCHVFDGVTDQFIGHVAQHTTESRSSGV